MRLGSLARASGATHDAGSDRDLAQVPLRKQLLLRFPRLFGLDPGDEALAAIQSGSRCSPLANVRRPGCDAPELEPELLGEKGGRASGEGQAGASRKTMTLPE